MIRNEKKQINQIVLGIFLFFVLIYVGGTIKECIDGMRPMSYAVIIIGSTLGIYKPDSCLCSVGKSSLIEGGIIYGIQHRRKSQNIRRSLLW